MATGSPSDLCVGVAARRALAEFPSTIFLPRLAAAQSYHVSDGLMFSIATMAVFRNTISDAYFRASRLAYQELRSIERNYATGLLVRPKPNVLFISSWLLYRVYTSKGVEDLEAHVVTLSHGLAFRAQGFLGGGLPTVFRESGERLWRPWHCSSFGPCLRVINSTNGYGRRLLLQTVRGLSKVFLVLSTSSHFQHCGSRVSGRIMGGKLARRPLAGGLVEPEGFHASVMDTWQVGSPSKVSRHFGGGMIVWVHDKLPDLGL
ncbi:hypothetical protein M434DRAFT_29898 [Hypoxylon sp. CO27-5]|nr:hypothetical protein M434DRAFT_29898 [Hypoxylon sp. CO27-5]